MTNRKQTPTTTSGNEAPFGDLADGGTPRKRRAPTRKISRVDASPEQHAEPGKHPSPTANGRGSTVDLDTVIVRALRRYTTSGMVSEITRDKRLSKFLYGFLHDVHPIPAGDRFFMVHVTP